MIVLGSLDGSTCKAPARGDFRASARLAISSSLGGARRALRASSSSGLSSSSSSGRVAEGIDVLLVRSAGVTLRLLRGMPAMGLGMTGAIGEAESAQPLRDIVSCFNNKIIPLIFGGEKYVGACIGVRMAFIRPLNPCVEGIAISHQSSYPAD